jgi:hypothetical protein
MGTGALSLGEKRPGREADHSPPSSAEVNNAWSYTSTPQYIFMAWCLVKHRDNFTFTLPLFKMLLIDSVTKVGDIPVKNLTEVNSEYGSFKSL